MIEVFATETPHVIPHAEVVFTLFGIPITNSMLLGWIVSVAIVTMIILIARHVKLKSSGRLTTVIELAVDGITNLADSVMHNRKNALKYTPFLVTLFLFIMLNNWAGLLPGVGSITYHGEHLFRAWTSDLTGTLALAICSIIIIQIYSFRELKIKGVAKHYFSDKPWNPINLFVGLLEILGEFTRVASLSLRLFGNVFAGEVLLIVLSAITSYLTPVTTLPFVLLEIFVGFIQAFVFTTLVIVYLALATTSHDHDEINDVVSSRAENGPQSDKQLVTEGSH